MKYRTEIVATASGDGYVGIAARFDGKAWRAIGESKAYRTYPAAVRARTAAESLCRRHWMSLPFALRIGTGFEISAA
jgi:hypothetical protein